MEMNRFYSKDHHGATGTELHSPVGKKFFTVESAVEKIGTGKFQILLMIATGFVWLSDAMEMMLLSVIAPTLKCAWHLSTFEEAFITTVVFIGMMFGSTFWGVICDSFGRKKGVILSAAFVFYFGLLSSQVHSYAWILIIRLLVGFAIGGVPQVVTVVTEFLPNKTRGKCIILLELFWAIGSMFAVALAFVVMHTLGWRYYLFFATFPSFLFLIMSFWFPESPRYLMTAGQPEKALAVLKSAARINGTTLPEGELYISNDKAPRGKLSNLMAKELRQLTCLLWIIWIASAFSYYGIVLLTTEMMQTQSSGCHPHGISRVIQDCEPCHILSQKDYLSFLWTTAAEFPGIVITYFMIERIGRKMTLFVSLFLACGFFCGIAFCTTRTISLAFIFAARAFISGAFQTAYVYTPEVFPTSVRALALGTCSSAARIGAMATPFVAQVVLESSFYYGVGVYASILFISAVACLLLPFDTKGRSLEDTVIETNSKNSEPGYNQLD